MVADVRERGLMYQRHRNKVLHATSEIDSTPPKLNIYTFLKLCKQKEDADRHDRVMKENIGIQVKINTIMRSYGRIRTFQAVHVPRSPLPHKIKMLRELEKKNQFLGRRVLCTKHEVQTRRPEDPRKAKPEKIEIFDPPELIMSKYKRLELPEDNQVLRQLMRPRIYFDMAIAGNRPLGRVIIQLYTEACPIVVLEFVRMCMTNEPDRVSIIHLFPNLWLECELKLVDIKESTPIEYDMRAVDHSVSPGVLSFGRHHLSTPHETGMDFSISFKPMTVLNGRRVGFGVVTTGNRMLASLQAYGTKHGKPLKNIIVSNCGTLPFR